MIFFVILLFGAYAADPPLTRKSPQWVLMLLPAMLIPAATWKEKRFVWGFPRSIDGRDSSLRRAQSTPCTNSWMPLGGLVPLLDMHLGETVLGGVGTGLYGMLAFAIVAVFVSGLMVGRTPEYLGKKIEIFDMKMVSIAILIMPVIVLIGMAVAVLANDNGTAGVLTRPARFQRDHVRLHIGRQ